MTINQDSYASEVQSQLKFSSYRRRGASAVKIIRAFALVLGLTMKITQVHALEVPGPLVEPQWLQAHLNDPHLMVIDVRDDAQNFYKTGHIPGARLWDMADKLNLVDLSGRVKNLPDSRDVTETMQKLGVNNGDAIVITTNGANSGDITFGTRAYWTVKYFGHNNVALLNGGTSHWANKDYPLSREQSSQRMGNFLTGQTMKGLIIPTAEMKNIVNGKTALPVDFRSTEVYSGEKKQPFVKAYGHIPGAVNLPVSTLFKVNAGYNQEFPTYLTFRSPQEIKMLATESGVNLATPLVAYCDSGHLSSGGLFAFRELLQDGKMRFYPGSLQAWADANLPAVRSASKK